MYDWEEDGSVGAVPLPVVLTLEEGMTEEELAEFSAMCPLPVTIGKSIRQLRHAPSCCFFFEV